MRRFPWVPLIVAGGIGVLTLGAPLRAVRSPHAADSPRARARLKQAL
jgi:hypothetical protein